MSRDKLLIDDSPLQVLPKLAVAIGLNEAIMLQQIHFWLRAFEKTENQQHFKQGKWWVWNSYEQWREDNFPFWSVRTVKRIAKKLIELELVISNKFNPKSTDQTKWYTIDYDALDKLSQSTVTECHSPSGQDVTLHSDNVSLSTVYTETNTETTTKTTTDADAPGGESTDEKPPVQEPAFTVQSPELKEGVATICYPNLEPKKAVAANAAMIVKALKKIKSVSPELLTPDGIGKWCVWWWAEDFRGVKGTRPEPKNIIETWLKFYDWHKGGGQSPKSQPPPKKTTEAVPPKVGAAGHYRGNGNPFKDKPDVKPRIAN